MVWNTLLEDDKDALQTRKLIKETDYSVIWVMLPKNDKDVWLKRKSIEEAFN